MNKVRMKRDCEHGQLARSCYICELKEENEKIRSLWETCHKSGMKMTYEIDRLQKRLAEARQIIRGLTTCSGRTINEIMSNSDSTIDKARKWLEEE